MIILCGKFALHLRHGGLSSLLKSLGSKTCIKATWKSAPRKWKLSSWKWKLPIKATWTISSNLQKVKVVKWKKNKNKWKRAAPQGVNFQKWKFWCESNHKKAKVFWQIQAAIKTVKSLLTIILHQVNLCSSRQETTSSISSSPPSQQVPVQCLSWTQDYV